jgi:DnaJ-class molecular chaperone
MIYLILFFIIAALAFLFYGSPMLSSSQKCQKCEGQGYWIGTRGDRQNCDVCKGTGKVPK